MYYFGRRAMSARFSGIMAKENERLCFGGRHAPELAISYSQNGRPPYFYLVRPAKIIALICLIDSNIGKWFLCMASSQLVCHRRHIEWMTLSDLSAYDALSRNVSGDEALHVNKTPGV